MSTLSPSGEVAEFIDFSQFVSGESVDQCGPASVSMLWHSTAPGTHNPYSPGQCQSMMDADYSKFIGPDVPSDHNGTSNETLYAMLQEHGFHFQGGPARMSWVKAELGRGNIVIIGIVESSVHDNGTGGVPYSWDTTGLTHIIVASGPGNDNEIAVRDTANIGPQGVRPGPRYYDANRLQLVSATSVTPTWLSGNPTPPAAPAPAAAPTAQDAWNAGGMAKAPYVQGHGIPDSYAAHFDAGRYLGYPLESEHGYKDTGGVQHMCQGFSAGYADWRADNNATSWKTPAGEV